MKVAVQLILASLLFSILGCQKNKFTGRRTLHLVNEEFLAKYSAEQYKSVLNESIVINDSSAESITVKATGNKIKKAVESYYNTIGQSEKLKYYQWEFNLIKNDTMVNAWCLPGGKVVVYTGLLKYAQTEEELAVVLGHEIAHAISNHGNKRMSEQILYQIGEKTMQIALIGSPRLVKNILMQSFGIPLGIGSLAFNREDEKEADKIGLRLMAMAGYSPEAASSFWTKMMKEESKQPLVIFSTHPNNSKRLKLINKEIPKAKKYNTTPLN